MHYLYHIHISGVSISNQHLTTGNLAMTFYLKRLQRVSVLEIIDGDLMTFQYSIQSIACEMSIVVNLIRIIKGRLLHLLEA